MHSFFIYENNESCYNYYIKIHQFDYYFIKSNRITLVHQCAKVYHEQNIHIRTKYTLKINIEKLNIKLNIA